MLTLASLAFPFCVLAHGVEIDMNEKGFSVHSVEIGQGESVTFRNTGKKPHWPASNIHPTHAILPEFDPKKGVPAAESWSFEFDKVGAWNFHDHLEPEYGGTVVVIPSDVPLPSSQAASDVSVQKSLWLGGIFDECSIFLRKTYYRFFPSRSEVALSSLDVSKLASENDGLKQAMAVFGPEKLMKRLLEQSGSGSTFDCHQQAHRLGRTAYRLFGATAFGLGDFSCHAGFPHGAMEALLRERGTDHLSDTLREICSRFPSQYARFECQHGIGHGVLAYENYDLPQSIAMCGSLDDDYNRSSCDGGVFMENIMASQGLGAIPGHSTKWASDDPLFPCDAIDQSGLVQQQCYLMQTSRMLTLYSYDFKKVAHACTRAPKPLISTCFRSLGRDVAGFTLRDPAKIREKCGDVDDAARRGDCIVGALNVIVDFFGTGLEDQAVKLCKILPEHEKDICYDALSSRFSDVFPDPSAQRKQCGMFEEKYRAMCAS